MKTTIKIICAFALITLTISLFPLVQSAAAVSSCKQANGKLNLVNNYNGTESGIITQGGRLDGTTQTVFTSAFTPTPDPNTFSFTDNLTLTTSHGVLVTRNVAIADVATGLFTAINRIDPNASTGDFARSVGVLYLSGKTTNGGATFQADITGEICFAD